MKPVSRNGTGARQRYTAEAVIKALHETRGLVTYAAERLGCTDETVYNYAKRYPTVAASLQRERNRRLDIARLKLYEALLAGEEWAVKLELRRDPDYVQKTEVGGPDGGPVQVSILELARMAAQYEQQGEANGQSGPAMLPG